MSLKELDSAELAIWLHRGEPVRLIDVRTPGETSRGIIANAENLPLHFLPLKADEVSTARPRVVFYCRSGARSAQACQFMSTRGFEEAYNLRGGIVDWVRQGLPVHAPAL